MVDEFGMSPTYHEVLLQFLLVMAEITLPMLAAPNGLVDNPDTVDDLYRLCSRLAQPSQSEVVVPFVDKI